MNYKIWSIQHGMWWKPARMGYTVSEAEAGIYSEADALIICGVANCFRHPNNQKPNEAMVPVE
jgi:hypothetical protein